MSDATKRKVDSTRKPVSAKHVPAELSDYAKRRKKAKLLGKGGAKKAANAIEKRRKMLRDI